MGRQQLLATLLSNDQVGRTLPYKLCRRGACYNLLLVQRIVVTAHPLPCGRSRSWHTPPAHFAAHLQTPVGPLERMVTRAHRLFDARAFVHRYERHGLACPADFEAAFEAAEGLLDAYRQL